MPGSQITMVGADSAYYYDALPVTHRLLRFPDGIFRLIGLANWQWDLLDRWSDITGEHPKAVTDYAFAMARECTGLEGSAGLEGDIRTSLVTLLRVCKASLDNHIPEAANGNS